MANAPEWRAKMKKGVLVTIMNNSPYTLELQSHQLGSGKFVKKSEPIAIVGPMDCSEMGFGEKPDGEFVWTVVEGDIGLNQLRLRLAGGAKKAAIEEVPPTAIWACNLSQNWGKSSAVSTVVLTVTQNASKKSLSKKPSEEIRPTPIGVSGHSKTSSQADDGQFRAMGDDSFDTSSEDDDVASAKQRRLSVIIQKSAVDSAGSDDLRSAASRLSLGSTSTQRRGSSPKIVKPEHKTNQDEFFTALANKRSSVSPASAAVSQQALSDMSEDEALQLALAVSQSEADARNAAQSTSTAKATNPQELNDAIAVLDAGQLEESAALFAATMQQVDRGSPILKELGAYRLLVALLLEVNRLEREQLWAQQAVIARFVAYIAVAFISNSNHKRVALRMAINKNMFVGNFFSAAEFIQMMSGLQDLSEDDIRAIQFKQQLCQQRNEASIPAGGSFDPELGPVLGGRRLMLCTESMRLIRASTFLRCTCCGATYSEQTRQATSKCIYCNSGLIKK